MQITLNIPEHVVDTLQIPTMEKVARLRQELGIRLYQKELLTFGKARELAQVTKWEFHELLAKENIERHYDIDELNMDLKTLEYLN